MELRVLRYFLETAREGNMTRAAERLHVTQPTLSKQIKELENELGKKLFERHNFSVSLTEEGMILRKRAEDLLAIADKIEDEFKTMDQVTGGTIHIGCAESKLIKYLAKAVKNLNNQYPNVHFNILSGDTAQVTEKLDNGVLDMAFIVEPPDLSKYNYVEIPEEDIWGVFIPKEHALAKKESITINDLLPYPVMCSEQSLRVDIPRWGGEAADKLNVVANFNLANNGLTFVREGVGLALGFEDIVEITNDTAITFRPFEPMLTTKMYGIWKKYQVFTPVACLLTAEIKKVMGIKD